MKKREFYLLDKSHAPRVFDSALIFPYIVSYLRHLERGSQPKEGKGEYVEC